MNIEPCSKVCHECGFLRGSPKGILTAESRNVIMQGIIFPCHLKLKAVTGSENQGIEDYVSSQPVVKVCRGYVVSMMKSGIPPLNEAWAKLYRDVGADLDTRVMDIRETLTYHNR